MSDSSSRRDAVNEFGISEDRPVDRRRFLAQLSGMSALGASFLALGNAGTALARGLSRTPAGGTARPIYMLSLGDSIMWGQGLAEPQKFRNIVQQWIRSNNPERRDVVQFNYTHSGASLGIFPFGAYGQSSRFLAQRRVRVGARIDPTGARDIDVADMDWPTDSIGRRIDREVAAEAAAERRPDAASLVSPREEAFGGEIPRANPILWRQLDMAVANLKSKNIDPGDVDLVLMDGGANDADFVMSILNPDWTPDWVEFQVRELVMQRMEGFLPWALKTFPNAKFVLTGYYAGVSDQTSVSELVATVAAVQPLYAALGLAFLVPTTIAGAVYFNATKERGAAFERATSAAMRAACNGSGGRAVFVSPEFLPENAYAAPQTFMFRFTDRDPAAAGREVECHTIYGAKSAAGSTGANVDALSPEGFCRRAATFHPNPAGAKRYADRVIAALPALMPLVNTASRSLRLTVQGTANGVMKTVTVTAVDAATGQPVTGTVSINGVRGATGAPVTFRGCVEAAESVGTGGKGVRAPVRPRGGATVTACTGSVTAPGYPTATFQY